MNVNMKKLLYSLFALYTVLPTYFRIGGINSQIIFVGLIVVVYLLSPQKKRIRGISLKYCILFFAPYALAMVLHAEWFMTIRQFLELVVLVCIITDCVRSNEDVLAITKKVVHLSLIEVVSAYVHFIFGFNVFSLLSNTTDINYTRSDFGAGTQYRYGMPRVEGSFSHAITFGIYLSICALLCLFLYQKTKKRQYMVFYAMHVVALFMTLSRMPILVFALSQIIILLIMNVKKTIKVLLAILGGLGVAALFITIAFPTLAEKISIILKMLTSVFNAENIGGIMTFNQNSAFSYRTEMLRNILPTIGNSLFAGIGAAGMSDYFFFVNGTIQRSVDNQYLYYLIIYGLLGLMFSVLWFAQLLFFRLKKGFAGIKRDLTEFVLYRNLIILVYGLNLLSVAMMEEYKIITVFISLSLCDVILNRGKYKVGSLYRRTH